MKERTEVRPKNYYEKVTYMKDLEARLEALMKSALENAEEEAKRMVQSAEQSKKKQLADLDDHYKLERARVEQEVKQQVDAELSEKLASAELESKRILNSARDRAIRDSLNTVVDFVRAERGGKLKEAYQKFCERRIEEALSELKKVKVRCGAVEHSLLKKYKNLLELDKSLDGMVIESVDGSIAYDYRVESIVFDRLEDLRVKIHELLFQERKKKS